MNRQEQAIKRLSGGGCLQWQFKGFLALRKLLAVIMLLLMALPSFAGDFDWNDNYVWKDAEYDAQTHTWSWTTIVYDYNYSDEGWVKGNNLKTYLIYDGHKILVGETSCGSGAEGKKFEPNEDGKKLGFVFSEKGFNDDSKHKNQAGIYMDWVVPREYLQKGHTLKLCFEGNWTDNNSKNSVYKYIEHDVSKTHQYVLWTPEIINNQSQKVELHVTKVTDGKPQWEYHIPFKMNPPKKKVDNPLYVDDISLLNADVATTSLNNTPEKYRRDTIGTKLTDLCKVTPPDSGYNVAVKSKTVFKFIPDSVYDKEAQSYPQFLRKGMSILLRNSLSATFLKSDKKTSKECIYTVPEASSYELRIPTAPYPQSLTATFISTDNIVRLSWVAKSREGETVAVKGTWKIFQCAGTQVYDSIKLVATIPIDKPVPSDRATYTYDVHIQGDALNFYTNPEVTYYVAWEPEGVIIDSDAKKDFKFFPELTNSKKINLSLYINLSGTDSKTYDQSVYMYWTATTNSSSAKWNGQCDIWDENGFLKTVTPFSYNAKTGVREYKFFHITSVADEPEDKIPFLRDNLSACSPHNYEVRASFADSTGQYSRIFFRNLGVGKGVAFRTADVSKGIYSNKVRVAATTNKPADTRIMYKVLRKAYGDNCDYEDNTISVNSPVGTIGMLNGREAIVVELNVNGKTKKVAIATKNVGATSVEGTGSYGTYFTYEDANNPIKTGLSDGWYVPSKAEIDALSALSKSWNSTKKGYEWTFNGGVSSLFIPAAGWKEPGKTTTTYQGTYGDYWLSTQNSNTKGWNLFFHSGNYQVRGYDATYQFAVRPFCELSAHTPGWAEVYTQDNGSATMSWEDYGAAPGTYFIYRIKAGYLCEDNKQVFIQKDILGFCQNTGIVSGKVTYGGGSAAQNINIDLVPNPEDSLNRDLKLLHSMELNDLGAAKWAVPDKQFANHLAGGDFTVQFWVNPQGIAQSRNILTLGNLELKTDAEGVLNLCGVSLNKSLEVGQWTHITISYDKRNQKYRTIVFQPVLEDGRDTYNAVTDLDMQANSVTISAPEVFALSRGNELTLGGIAGLYDDFRLYSRLLTAQEQCDTYDRHLHGEENGLDIYWTFNEGLVDYAFDTSRSGTQLNGRHAVVTDGRTTNYTDVPAVGFRTRTDKYGNYMLRGIPFSTNNGISYLVTPNYTEDPLTEGAEPLRHSFSPADRLHVVSAGSLVHNSSNYEDVSSFPFYGNVTYMYGDIPADSIDVYVDGIQQSNEDGNLMTDRNGNFRVDVPIGEHYISLARKGHRVNARWPEDPKGRGVKHLFASAEGLGTESQPIHFTDSTLALVVGRVVGGDIQASLPFAQPQDSTKVGSKANIGMGTVILELASSGGYKINTGKEPLNLALEFSDSIDFVDTGYVAEVLPQSGKVRIQTNPRTGEFYALLPPVSYIVDSVFTKDYLSYGLREDFGSTASYAFTPLPTDTICDSTYIYTTGKDGKLQKKDATFMYNYKLNFVRHNAPVYELRDETAIESLTSDTTMTEDKAKFYFGDRYYDMGGNYKVELFTNDTTVTSAQKSEDLKKLYHLDYPVYTSAQHSFRLSAFEIYTNPDNPDSVMTDSVPLIGRTIKVVNGLGLTSDQPDSIKPEVPVENIVIDSLGYSRFSVIPGCPNFTEPYLLNLALTDRVTGEEFFRLPVYVFGEKDIDGASFVTKGPEKAEYVIHDPYGTNSSAWLEAGSTTSHTVQWTGVTHEEYYNDAFNFGVNGAAGWKNDILIKNTEKWVTLGITGGYEDTEQRLLTDGSSIKTVTTNKERISTSDSPDYVGPPADLFVGDSYNVRISAVRKLGLWRKNPDVAPTDMSKVIMGPGNAVNVGPHSSTRFVYTRHHIENELIPELRSLRRNLFREPQNEEMYGKYTVVAGVDIDDPNLDWDHDSIYSWDDNNKTATAGQDMALYYTQSIANWIKQLRDDEETQAAYHESVASLPQNYSINTGTTYNNSYSAKIAYTNSDRYESSLKKSFVFDMNLSLGLKWTSSGDAGGGGGSSGSGIGADEVGELGPLMARRRKLFLFNNNDFKVSIMLNARTKSLTERDYKDSVTVTTDTWTSNLNWGYQLKETVLGNSVSQDVYTTELEPLRAQKDSLHGADMYAEGSPIFILRGGITGSPWEKALHMKYFDMKDPGNPDNIIGSDTQPLCVPVISFPNEIDDHCAERMHLRAGHPVTINMRLQGLSPQKNIGIDYILTSYANDDASALNMKVDGLSIVGAERVYRLYPGTGDSIINTPLVVSQTRPDKYDYDTWIYFLAKGQSSYDSPMGYIADSVRLKLHFDPTSSDVSITPGASVLNLESKGNLQLRVDDYDRSLDNFCCIDLMYRRPDEGEFNHTFARYWVNEKAMKDYGSNNLIPVLGKEFQQAQQLPEGPRFVHDFDMSKMYDGEYYITAVARSYYPNGAGGTTKAFAAEYQCDPVHILKDMTAPEVLGRPTPTNNYLTIRDQAVATFTEDINTNRLVKYRNVLAYLKDGEALTPVDINFSADERHIYIDLEPSRRQVHGKYVRFVVKGVEDVAGNVMADSVAWDAYADLSTFDWDHEVVNLTATVSELASLSFSPVLLNNTQRTQSYKLKDDPYSDVHQLPSWLTAVTRGTLPALSTAPVEFRIAGTPEIGKHQATVFVVSDSGTICTPLTVNLTVVGDEPDIPFDLSLYPHNMSVIARVEVPEGEFKYPGRDIVYAFAGTTCVGKSLITHKTDTTTNKVQRNIFMEVYGNEAMNRTKPEIRFVAWDAATNTLYPTVTSSEPVQFKNNQMVGTVASPLMLTVQDDTQIGIGMTEGWNWTSFNVELGDTLPVILKPLLQYSSTVTAKSHTEAVTMSGGNATGDLKHRYADPTAMYAVKLDGAGLLRLVGKPVDPATHPVTLAGGGWTWIGYIPQGYNNVNAALANLKATEGDIIKSQTAFSMYHENTNGVGSWYGELDALYPGQGYKYLSNNSADVQFCYAQPKSAVRSKARRQESADNHWDVTTHYADNMTVLGCVMEDGNVVTHGEIGCFVGTECRGRARVESNGYAFVVVQGTKKGEAIQCYYWDDESETEHIVSPALSYASDACLGTFDNPVQLILDDAYGIVEVDEADGDYEYYNLQGLRVDRLALQRGSIYIRTNGVSTDKILKK